MYTIIILATSTFGQIGFARTTTAEGLWNGLHLYDDGTLHIRRSHLTKRTREQHVTAVNSKH